MTYSAELFFKESIESHMKYLKNLRSENQLVCVLLTYNESSGVHVWHLDISDQSPMTALKPIVYNTKPEYYIVFAEGWSVDSKHLEKPASELVHGDIEKMKKRKEVLNIYGKSKDGKYSVSKMFEIKRNKKKLVQDLIEIKGELHSRHLP